MAIYLIVFSISSIFLYLSEKKKKRTELIILEFIGITLIILLAGLRNTNIGTDINVYVKPMYEYALSTKDIKKYFGYAINGRKISEYEIGFTLIVFIFSKIFKNINILLLIISALTIVPIFIGMKKYECIKGEHWLAMLVFDMMFFNISLNAMRQYIGIAFAFLSISMLLNKKSIIKCIGYFIIGCLFHKSIVLELFLIIIYFYTSSKKVGNKTLKIGRMKIKIFRVLIFIEIAVIMLLLSKISLVKNWLGSAQGLERYSGYVGRNIEGLSISIKAIPLILLFILTAKKTRKEKNYGFFLNIFLFEYLIINQIAGTTQYSSRIGYLFEIFNIIMIPTMCKKVQNKSKPMIYMMVLMYLTIYWWYYFAYLGYNQTVPYKFF